MHGRVEIAETPTLPGVWKAKSGGWYVRGRVVDPKTGRLREVSRVLDVAEPAEALVWLKQELARVRAGQAQAKTSRMRFAEYAASLLERKIQHGRIWSPAGKEKNRIHLEHHLLPHFGAMWIDAITLEDVEAWKDKVAARVTAKELAPTTANSHLASLKAILRKPLPEIGQILPFDTSGHVTYTEEEPNALTPEQVPIFLTEIRRQYPQHFAMTSLGIATGLRPSSMRGIRRAGITPDLNWDTGVLLVRRSVTLGEVTERTKTGKRQRINLPPDMMAIFRWHLMRLGDVQQESQLLFPSDVGGFRTASVLDKPFAAVCLELSLPKVTPRGLRRTYQDLARAAEVHDIVLRSVSGHATETMQEHYSTVNPDEQRAALAKVLELGRFREILGA